MHCRKKIHLFELFNNYSITLLQFLNFKFYKEDAKYQISKFQALKRWLVILALIILAKKKTQD